MKAATSYAQIGVRRIPIMDVRVTPAHISGGEGSILDCLDREGDPIKADYVVLDDALALALAHDLLSAVPGISEEMKAIRKALNASGLVDFEELIKTIVRAASMYLALQEVV